MMQVVATKREIQNLQHPIELHPAKKDYQGQDPRVIHPVVPDSIPEHLTPGVKCCTHLHCHAC